MSKLKELKNTGHSLTNSNFEMQSVTTPNKTNKIPFNSKNHKLTVARICQQINSMTEKKRQHSKNSDI